MVVCYAVVVQFWWFSHSKTKDEANKANVSWHHIFVWDIASLQKADPVLLGSHHPAIFLLGFRQALIPNPNI